jgi:hypothetical protein
MADANCCICHGRGANSWRNPRINYFRCLNAPSHGIDASILGKMPVAPQG